MLPLLLPQAEMKLRFFKYKTIPYRCLLFQRIIERIKKFYKTGCAKEEFLELVREMKRGYKDNQILTQRIKLGGIKLFNVELTLLQNDTQLNAVPHQKPSAYNSCKYEHVLLCVDFFNSKEWKDNKREKEIAIKKTCGRRKN